MEEVIYELEIGDVVLVSVGGYGLVWEDKEKYVEIVGKGDYFGREGVRVKPYQCKLETLKDGTGEMGVGGVIGYETFGDSPLVLLNTGDSMRFLIGMMTSLSVLKTITPQTTTTCTTLSQRKTLKLVRLK